MNAVLKQIRWQQRFINFLKAFELLSEGSQKKEFSNLERAGLIQFFETTFELSWKVLKDYLEFQGYLLLAPRESIRQAFALGLIEDAQDWLFALEKRNLFVHTYQEELAVLGLSLIQNKFVSMFQKMSQIFKTKTFEHQKFGFTFEQILDVVSILSGFSKIACVKIFGSRALGNFKLNSDVDICLFGEVTIDDLSQINERLKKSTLLPFSFDIVLYSFLKKEDALRSHIDNHGIILFNAN